MPVFFDDPVSEPLIPYDMEMLRTEYPEVAATRLSWDQLAVNIDEDLVEAWTYTRRFCTTINHAAELKRQLPKDILLNSMASIMYRLLHMRSFPITSTNEALRLGLLVFSSHIFLSWQDVKPRHTQLPQVYRSCLLNLDLPSALPSQILLWLLMIGSISVFTSDDDPWLLPWIRVNIDLCEVQSWSELRGELKACPWIDFLHDQLGKTMYDTAQSHTRDSAGKFLQ